MARVADSDDLWSLVAGDEVGTFVIRFDGRVYVVLAFERYVPLQSMRARDVLRALSNPFPP